MKKSILAIFAIVTLSTSVMAQSENAPAPQNPQMDQTEMIKNQTDRMVKEYGLNETQAAQLQELNKNFADKMPRMRGPRPGGQRGGNGQRGGGMRPRNNDNGATAQGQAPERPSREQMEARMKEMRENMEAYEAGLKKIMTEEQFAKYQESRRNRMGGGQGFGRRGPRGGNE